MHMTSTRDRIIETTRSLLEAQGYHATGLNQIVKESDAPKGSLYYYFPDGKEEIVAEAIQQTGTTVAARLAANLGQIEDAAEAIEAMINTIALAVEATHFQTGGPLMMVAMETATTSERLNLACREAYSLLQAAFQAKLEAGGFSLSRAAELATFVTAAIEGGTMLSRTYHSGDPLRQVAREVGHCLRAARQAA
jgi:TetR/AcrR family transcriptional regulator, lmrAB and yxaGH operons repressor